MAVSFLVLVNSIVEVISDGRASEIMDGNETFAELNIDSLTVITLGSYIIEFYGLPKELEKSWMPKTANEMYNTVWEHKTKTPTTVKACLELVQ